MPRNGSPLLLHIKILSVLCVYCFLSLLNQNKGYLTGAERKAFLLEQGEKAKKSTSVIVKNSVNSALTYFNARGRRLRNKLADYPKNGPVVAILVASRQKDVDEVCVALQSLVFLQGDDKEHPTPVLIFNEGDLGDDQISFIIGCTSRPIAFPLVDFTSFPEAWDHETSTKMFRVDGRKEWGYYQMIRFWVTGIWKHPALDPYEIVMRMDTDSCFKEVNDNLPNFEYDNMRYHSQYVGVEDGKNFTIGFLDHATKWMEDNGRVPGDPMLWDFIKSTWKKHRSLPVYRTNFELTTKSFMLQKSVMEWHESLTEKEPFGVFEYRWGDAVERFLTMAMFTTNDKILTKRVDGYGHKENCPKEEVERAVDDYLSQK